MKTSKERIFAEAAILFREKGYMAASMRDLADRVGLKPSSFYSHIKSKEEILQKICFDNANAFLHGMRQVEQTEASPEEQVKSLLQLHIRMAIDNPTSITVFNDEWRHLSEPYLSDFLQMRKDYESRFLSIFQKGIKTKVFKAIHPHVALNTMLSAIRWLHDWHRKPRKIPKSTLENDLINMLMSGLVRD